MWPPAVMGLMQPPPPAQLDRVALFGFLSAFAAFACWVERDRSATLRMLLGPCLAALAAYGFLAGAWPLGLVLGFASVVTVARYWKRPLIWPARSASRRARGWTGTRFGPAGSRSEQDDYSYGADATGVFFRRPPGVN